MLFKTKILTFGKNHKKMFCVIWISSIILQKYKNQTVIFFNFSQYKIWKFLYLRIFFWFEKIFKKTKKLPKNENVFIRKNQNNLGNNSVRSLEIYNFNPFAVFQTSGTFCSSFQFPFCWKLLMKKNVLYHPKIILKKMIGNF